MHKTLFVNIFAGPGTGKSTHAAGVFSMLKRDGVNAELITEYAKDLTWKNDRETLICQPYVTAKQLFRFYRVMNKIQVGITDAPLPMSLAYGGFGKTDHFEEWVMEMFNHPGWENINIFLIRDNEAHPYNPSGRNQTESEAMEKDQEIKEILIKHKVPVYMVKVSNTSIDDIYNIVQTRLK